jgi:flagellar biosynthesis protein FlhG
MEYDSLNIGLKLVVNRARGVKEAKDVADRMITIAGQYINIKVDYLGFIYDDQTVPMSVRQQKPFMVVDPKCKASICIQHLVERMDKTKLIEQPGSIGTMFKKLFGRS